MFEFFMVRKEARFWHDLQTAIEKHPRQMEVITIHLADLLYPHRCEETARRILLNYLSVMWGRSQHDRKTQKLLFLTKTGLRVLFDTLSYLVFPDCLAEKDFRAKAIDKRMRSIVLDFDRLLLRGKKKKAELGRQVSRCYRVRPKEILL